MPEQAKSTEPRAIYNSIHEQKTSLAQDILALFIKIFAILTAFVLLFTFLFGFTIMPDASMQPAIQAGDIVLFYRLDKANAANDVVALEYEDNRQIRRVVAIAGDTVDITEEGLFINGSYAGEQNTQEILLYTGGITFPVTVPQDHVFLLADYRSGGIDSRIYGTVAIKDLQGRVITILRHGDI